MTRFNRVSPTIIQQNNFGDYGRHLEHLCSQDQRRTPTKKFVYRVIY